MNSLFIIKTYLICHAFVIPAKISFCWLIINDSRLQLVLPEHRTISLKNTAVHLMTKIACLMIVQNVHLENYTNYPIPILIQELTWILILILIQAAWYLSTLWKHPTSVLPKYVSVSHLRKLPRDSKNSLSLKRHIYLKRSQNRHYNHVKESLDHRQIIVHVDYTESYKNSQQNEIQSAYFGNSTFNIFTACCHTKSLDKGGRKKDSIVVVNDSKEHNRAAALTYLKKVVEKAVE